jgi:hypothetical protein
VSALSGISGLLGWDEMVQCPPGAVAARGAQKSALAGVVHEKSTDPEIGELLARLQAGSLAELDEFQQVGWWCGYGGGVAVEGPEGREGEWWQERRSVIVYVYLCVGEWILRAGGSSRSEAV